MNKLIGFIREYEDGTYSVWAGDLDREDEEKISEILTKYENKGISVKGPVQNINFTDVVNATSTCDKVREILDEIYSSSNTLAENFGDEICREITEYFMNNDYDVDRKIVEEATYNGVTYVKCNNICFAVM